jgi:cytochrome b pre-mRNA-processing protein 3
MTAPLSGEARSKESRMLAWMKQLGNRRQTARSLYGSIVTQARSPSLYARWGVPDTAEGRFEMIALHLVLVLARLAREGEPGHRLGRALTETFVGDVDDTLREMTVGDLAVPRHVKHAVAVLHDRYATYGAALDAEPGGDKLVAAIQARLAPLRGAESLDAAALRAYIAEAARMLATQPGAEVLAGRLGWPQTETGS